MRICLAQIAPSPGDLPANLEKIQEIMGRVAAEGGGLLVFPELSTTGYIIPRPWDEVALSGADLASALSPPPGVMAFVGFAEAASDGAIYNSTLILSSDGEPVVHRKMFLVDYGHFEEHKHFHAGRGLTSVRFGGVKVGVLICNDAWHPSIPFMLYAFSGADILVIQANSAVHSDIDNPGLWPLVTRSLALTYGVYVVFANRVGSEAGWSFWGGSHIVNPFGTIIVQADGREEDLISGHLQPRVISQARDTLPTIRDQDLAFLKSLLSQATTEEVIGHDVE